LAQYYEPAGSLLAPTRPIPLLQARNWQLDLWKPKRLPARPTALIPEPTSSKSRP
jgi:hypothetical protein